MSSLLLLTIVLTFFGDFVKKELQAVWFTGRLFVFRAKIEVEAKPFGIIAEVTTIHPVLADFMDKNRV